MVYYEPLRIPLKNTPPVFHVETTWKRPLPRRFNVEYTWSVCWAIDFNIVEKTLWRSYIWPFRFYIDKNIQ